MNEFCTTVVELSWHRQFTAAIELTRSHAETTAMGFYLLQERYQLSKQEVLHAAMSIASGLDAVHAKGIVHCDLKPANILVKPVEEMCASDSELSSYLKGTYKLADFGIVRYAGDTTQLVDGKLLGTLP